MIRSVNEGRTDELTPALMATAAQGGGISLLPFLAVSCRDDGAHSFYAGSGKPSAGYYMLDPAVTCKDWTTPASAPAVAKGTRVPTLVLAGSLDPITPPPNGRAAAGIIGPAATFVEIPGAGHSVGRSPCGSAIIEAFLAKPGRKLDTSCAANAPRVEFNK